MKKGFTTGTCAQAAAKGAASMLVNRKMLEYVDVRVPSGDKFNLKLIGQKIRDNSAFCGVIKDSGDDPDITDGIEIYAEVKFSSRKGVVISAGKGIGRVTKPGLAIVVGEAAINPVPRKMIDKEVSYFLPESKGFEVIISAPKGKELAQHTFNPRLGIVAGISIIGTSGLVLPKSLDAYKASLSLQLDVLRALRYKRAVLVLGYVGEKFARETLKADEDSVIKIGDHVGFMLKECKKKKIEEVLLAGHIGKLAKIVKGQFDTHSRFGDNRVDTIADCAKACGAGKGVIKELLRQVTAEATIDILRENKLNAVFEKLAWGVIASINKSLGAKMNISCALLSLKGEVLNE